MTQFWEPGTQYGHGSVVEYQGHRYKIIQPHTSQSDWAPSATPALWGRLDDHDNGQGGHGGGHGGPPPQHHGGEHGGQQQGWQPGDQHHGHEAGYQPQQQWGTGENNNNNNNNISQEEKKKNWYDLDDEQKKKVEIGGGLLAGAAALGAGYFAYKEHEKSGEEKKAQTWALSNWLSDGEARAEDFRRNGLRGPAQWILNRGKQIPRQAIVVGQEKSWTLYIARAFHDGGIQLGKASDVFKKGAVIGYGHEEIQLDTYEILVGDMRGLKWVDMSGRLNIQALNARPVEGGREADGTPLYIAAAPHKGAVHPGKCSEKLSGAFIPYDNDEKEIKSYQVLCYA